MYSKLMIILTKNQNVLSSKTINGSEMGNECGKGSIPLILFIKLRYSEFRILMPMVHVYQNWVPYAICSKSFSIQGSIYQYRPYPSIHGRSESVRARPTRFNRLQDLPFGGSFHFIVQFGTSNIRSFEWIMKNYKLLLSRRIFVHIKEATAQCWFYTEILNGSALFRPDCPPLRPPIRNSQLKLDLNLG